MRPPHFRLRTPMLAVAIVAVFFGTADLGRRRAEFLAKAGEHKGWLAFTAAREERAVKAAFERLGPVW